MTTQQIEDLVGKIVPAVGPPTVRASVVRKGLGYSPTGFYRAVRKGRLPEPTRLTAKQFVYDRGLIRDALRTLFEQGGVR